jgi:hypothetical protein
VVYVAIRFTLHPWPVATAPNPEAYLLAYEEAKRALDEQEQAVGELRSRAGQLIAAAAITTSFFGGQALHRHVHTLGWVAIACFVSLSLSVLVILWPRRDWEFSLSPAKFISTYIEPPEGDPLDLPMIHRDLALHMGRSANLNRDQLRWLTGAFRLGAILLVAEVVAWVIVLINQS